MNNSNKGPGLSSSDKVFIYSKYWTIVENYNIIATDEGEAWKVIRTWNDGMPDPCWTDEELDSEHLDSCPDGLSTALQEHAHKASEILSEQGDEDMKHKDGLSTANEAKEVDKSL